LSPIPPDPEVVLSTAGIVREAQNVVVIAGLGAVEADAGPACRALAAKSGGLLATSLPARGLFHDDPYCIGISGSYTTEVGHEYLAEADLVILVGCSLAFHLGGGGQLWPKAKMIHIDVDPLAVSQGQEVATHHLRADARLGTEALTEALPASSNPWRSNAIAERIRVSKPDSFEVEVEPDLFDPRDVVEALEDHLPLEWEIVNSSGHCAGFTAHMPSRPQSKFLTIREFGAIGNGTSFAMGVAAARPDSKVVLFDGDGSLLMNIQELETIKRHNLNILIIAMNDGAYGSEVHKFRSEGLSEDGSVFGYSDFAGIAQGFGITGHKVSDLADVPKLVAECADNGGPAVWDFHLSDKVVSSVLRRAHPQPKKST
ncbi:MAG: thiamine pyrophosphate-dependent enzyme, partial [Pseudomonadota bacterium]